MQAGDSVFMYTSAHPDFVQSQGGAYNLGTYPIDYNLYIQRTNAMQEGLRR